MEEEPKCESCDDESDEILNSAVEKNAHKILSLENDEAPDGELNYQIIQVESVESLKNLKPQLDKVLVVILLKPDGFESFFDEFKSPETIFEVHDGGKIYFKRKSSNPLIMQFLGIMNGHGISFKDKKISLEANCALKSSLNDSLKSKESNTIKTLFNLMNLLKNTCTGLLELLAMSIESPHAEVLSKEIFMNFYSVYETETKVQDVKINQGPSFLEMQLNIQNLNKQWTKYLNELQYLFDNCDKNELFAFLVHTNCHKFLKLFISVYPTFTFDELQDKVQKAMTQEFFDTLKILLDMRGDDDFDINPYKVTMGDVEELFKNIESMNEAKLKQFCNKHPGIKVCRYQNTTALEYALDTGIREENKKNKKRFSAFSLLKVNSFKSSDPEDPGLDVKISKFPDEDKKVIAESNIEHAVHDEKNYISVMEGKFKGMSKFSSHEVRKMIKELGEISQIEPMLKIASKNAELKVVVDGENDNLEGVDPRMDKNTKGAAYHAKRLIVLGTDKVNHSHYGHFSHELTHVVMSVVYENNCLPYRRENTKRVKYFDEVFEETRKAFYEDRDFEDIIRWWYEGYKNLDSLEDPKEIEEAKNLLKKELIVRPAHMLAEYRNDKSKIEVLRKKYKALFDFFDNHVVPDLNTYLGFHKEELKLLGKFKNIEYSLVPSHKEKFAIYKNKKIVIKTNSPRLALQEFYNELIAKESSVIQVNSKNLFVNLEEVDKKLDLHTQLDTLLKSHVFKRVIFDGTYLPKEFKRCKELIKNILQSTDLNCFVVVSEKKFFRNKSNSIPVELLQFEELPVSYTFDSLESESKEEMLNKPLSFQGQDFQLKDLIEDLTIDVINFYLGSDEFLEINKPKDEGLKIFIPRTLMKKIKIETQGTEKDLCNPTTATPATSPPSKEVLIEEKQILPYKVEFKYEQIQPNQIFQKFVLISDFSGAGKTSLLMKHKDELIANYPNFWISYVALDNFAEAFSDDNFLSYINDIVNDQVEIQKRAESKQKWEEEIKENECLASRELKKLREVLSECVEAENPADDSLKKPQNVRYSDEILCSRTNVDNCDTNDDPIMNRINPEHSNDNVRSSVILRATSRIQLTHEDIEKRLKTPDNLILAHFFARFILKLTNPVEIAIFLHLYKNVQVILFLDGLNEISLESQKNFLKLCKSFQSLQIWISTTENLEKEVEKKLKTLAYSIKPMNEQEQVDFLVRTWKSTSDGCEKKLEEHAIEIIKSFPRLITSDTSKIISMPLPIRMAAEVYKFSSDEDEPKQKFKICDVFRKYLKVDNHKLNEFHQFYAFKRIIKNEEALMEILECVEEKDNNEESEILKFDNTNRPFFKHDIFGEFFIAEFIGSRLKRIGSLQMSFYNFLVDILNKDDHRLVRYFLSDIVDELKNDSQLNWCGKNFEIVFGSKVVEFEKLRCSINESKIFHWKLDEEVSVKERHFGIMLCASAEGQLNICKFLLNVYKQNLRNKHPILKPKDGFGRNFLANILRYPHKHNLEVLIEVLQIVLVTLNGQLNELLMEIDSNQSTIFHYFALPQIQPEIFTKLWNLIKSHYNEESRKKLVLKKDNYKNNATFIAVVRRSPNFLAIFDIFRNVLDEEALKDFCKSEDQYGGNVVHLSAMAGLNRFQTVFDFVIKANLTDEELKILFKQKNNYNNTPLRLASIMISSEEIVVLWEWISKLFTHEEIEEMIKEPGEGLKNALEFSICNKDPKVFRFFFMFLTNRKAFFQDKWKDEVILEEEDLMIEDEESNASAILKRPTTLEFLEQAISEVYYTPSDESPTTLQDEIEVTLRNKDEDVVYVVDKNLLKDNPHRDISRRYGCRISMRDLKVLSRKIDPKALRDAKNEIAANDGSLVNSGLGLIGQAICKIANVALIMPLEGNDMKKTLIGTNCKNFNLLMYLAQDSNLENIHFIYKELRKELSNAELIEFLKSEDVRFSHLLSRAVIAKNMQVFDFLWSLFEKCLTREEFKSLIAQQDSSGDNMVHYSFTHLDLNGLKTVWEKVCEVYKGDETEREENFGSRDLSTLAQMLGCHNNDILKVSAWNKNPGVFEYTWNLLPDRLKREKVYLLNDTDNLVMYTFTFANVEKAKFLWQEIKKLFTPGEIKDLLMKKGFLGRNLLFNSSCNNKSPDTLEFLWDVLINNIGIEEVTKMIKEADQENDTILHVTCLFNTKIVNELTWRNITKHILKDEASQKEFLFRRGKFNRSVLINSIRNGNEEVFIWLWKKHVKLFRENEEFKSLITELDGEAANVLSTVFVFPKIAKINIVCDEIKARDFDEQTIREIFTGLTTWKRNLLVQLTVNRSHKLLPVLLPVIEHGWKVIEGILGKEEIAKMCTANDAWGYNLLLLSAQFCSRKIFEFALDKIKFYVEDYKNILKKKTQQGMNVLQTSVKNHENLDNVKIVWEILNKTFKKDNFKNFLIEQDRDGNNVISELKKKAKDQKQYKELFKFVEQEVMKIFSKDDQEEIFRDPQCVINNERSFFARIFNT